MWRAAAAIPQFESLRGYLLLLLLKPGLGLCAAHRCDFLTNALKLWH